MPPTVMWPIIISGTGALVTFLGIVLSRIGQKGDQEQKFVTDQFQRMLGENGYLTAQLQQEREGRAADREAAEGRWSRQVNRCRTVMDQAWVAIAHLMGDPAKARDEGEQALRAIQGHMDADHPGGPHWEEKKS